MAGRKSGRLQASVGYVLSDRLGTVSVIAGRCDGGRTERILLAALPGSQMLGEWERQTETD